MKESLSMNQTQHLTQRLSPRQVQYVRMLEMTAPEIEEEVRRQLDDNPALEAVEPLADNDSEQEIAIADDIDADDDPADWELPGTKSREGYALQIETETPDLLALLNQQLGQVIVSDDIKRLAAYIIGNLDENGYLTRTLAAMADDIAIATGVDVTHEQMRQAFNIVREMEPAGVGAVDLRDCLMLQLARIPNHTITHRIAKEIVDENFDLLSKKHYDRLMLQLGLDDQEQLRQAINLIKSLNPKPGSAIIPSGSAQRLNQITPDVIVEELEDGRFSVSLATNLPVLQIEKSFAVETPSTQKASKNEREREAQAFIKLKRDEAETFISALKQRGNTLLDVSEAIVKRQPDFFRTGDTSTLKPMVLKDIAADTGHDLSAVSRATAGKYIATDMGAFPMKMFFNEAPLEDSDTSSHQLMHVLKEIVKNENPKHPYSDLALQKELEKRGHVLARRTITKYREKMGIPVGRLRKKI